MRADIFAHPGWSITHSWGGGQPDRAYLAEPFDSNRSKSLSGAEGLVFRRSFSGVDKGPARIEINQRLIHALDLYWLEEESAFCRLDTDGDVERVIKVVNLESRTGKPFDVLVTILSGDLARYMAVTDTALVWRFDFTRFVPNKFLAWTQSGQARERGSDLFYSAAAQPGASYVNGVMVARTSLSSSDLAQEQRMKWDDNTKQYATYLAYDWKNSRIDYYSCDPTELASYFDEDSNLPFQITPAFFKPEVLQRYKANPEKYTLDHRAIRSRAGWSLKTFDIDEAGQVHTYLHYLGHLPHTEQLYWQSFNEPPKASISARAYQTDILGEFSDDPDPLLDLIEKVRQLDERRPDWWLVRGDDLRKVVHYPVTTSPDEWGDSLLALDQLIVEGLNAKSIRKLLTILRKPYETSWGSLRLLQELFVARGFAPGDAADETEPLRRLHFLRSKVKGHSGGAERAQLIKEARSEHGSLKADFVQLAAECDEAFQRAIDMLDDRKSPMPLP